MLLVCDESFTHFVMMIFNMLSMKIVMITCSERIDETNERELNDEKIVLWFVIHNKWAGLL